MTISAGTRFRRYEVTAPLGVGGMGEVYLARDVELDRTVALKVLREGPDADGARNRRFIQEARAAISLNHPNIAHVYDAGEESGVRFLAMEYVEGETLRSRTSRGRLTLAESIDIATQIASALASAHALGIIHRDVKPENVMLRPDGYVKVLDFGLAKLTFAGTEDVTAPRVLYTEPGTILGTTQYMSPEQLRSGSVDARSDIFSLGVVLYEMISGSRPFNASSPSEVIAAILTEDPAPLDAVLPPGICAVVMKALAKDPDDRFASARDLVAALKNVRDETHRVRSGDIPTQAFTDVKPTGRRPAGLWIGAAVVLVAITAAVTFAVKRSRDTRQARGNIARIEKLAEQRRYFEAWDLGAQTEAVLGKDADLQRVLQKFTEELTVTTDPGGAQVYLQRVLPDGGLGPRLLAGTSPLSKYGFPRGDFVMTVEKQGFETVIRAVSTTPITPPALVIPQPAPPFALKLLPAGTVAANMVPIDGGPYKLTGWTFITDREVDLDPFFIDRYEVSNRQFAEFIGAGGYRRRELWKHPFVKDGRSLSFDEAVGFFRDSTGVAGPRGWAQGTYPEGRGNFPITDITWYEAAAYAEYAGKELPTIYQWDKAARNGRRAGYGSDLPWGPVSPGVDVMHRANFLGSGPMPVDSLPSGMSTWGVHHLAGNVTEFLRNRNGSGFAVAGGAFDDPTYQFGNVGSYPGFFSSPKVGFRCVQVSKAARSDQGAADISTENARTPVFVAIDDAEFDSIVRPSFEYEKTPLEVTTTSRTETADWIRERFTFVGSRGRRAIGYLYLPKGTPPPYQVVHFAPGGDVARGYRPFPASAEVTLGALIRGGRAVFGVVLEGYQERLVPADASYLPNNVVDHVIDVRRALDYLTSRPDVLADKIGMYAISAGADVAFVVTAIDPRYRSVALAGSGLNAGWGEMPAHLNRFNFLPRIAAPKVMLHGRYDERHPLRSQAEPVYKLMRGSKSMVVYEGGHVPLITWLIPELTKWFDKTLGPIAP